MLSDVEVSERKALCVPYRADWVIDDVVCQCWVDNPAAPRSGHGQ